MIRIFDTSLAFVGEVDNFVSCSVQRKYLGVETLDLTMPYVFGSLLLPHYILWLDDDKVFEILHRQVDGTNVDMLKVTAYGFGKTLAKRITVPPAGQAYDTATGSRDNVVKQYITRNLITATDTNRRVAYLSNAANQSGTSITETTRYKNLNDEVVRILAAADMGYKFTMVGSSIVFDTYTGTDRTSDSATPVIFSREYDNVKSRVYVSSLTEARNYIYAGGGGEGAGRTIRTTGTKTSYERFEFFTDARDTTDNAEIDSRALADYSVGITSFSAEVAPTGSFTYGTDYALGDIVTVTDKQLGLTMDARITEVTEVYQQGTPMEIKITFGNSYPTILNTIQNQRKQIAQRATV